MLDKMPRPAKTCRHYLSIIATARKIVFGSAEEHHNLYQISAKIGA